MIKDKKIAVVVPCYNEEKQISGVINTMPEFVDYIIVIDDASTDKTPDIIKELSLKNKKITFHQHEKNSGVGSAISTGYKIALKFDADVTAVMAGDGQMDPSDLYNVVYPIVTEIADYCKGNRFFYLKGLEKIPRHRLLGNFILSAFTKIVSGYWHISDTQCGYTAISKDALLSIDIDKIYPRYGCPNDILTKLNISDMRVIEVPVNPLYNIGEISKMKIPKVVFPITLLLVKLFFYRMLRKYIFKTGHPLVLAYILSGLLFITSLIINIYILVKLFITGEIPKAALITSGFTLIISLQLLVTAFMMDFDYNKNLFIKMKTTFQPENKKLTHSS
ncbi:MAG: glycosyltransferase family 2 protein [Candidatus Pacearchaeota archaeon]